MADSGDKDFSLLKIDRNEEASSSYTVSPFLPMRLHPSVIMSVGVNASLPWTSSKGR